MEDKIHYNEMMNAVYTKFMIHGACPGALAVAVVAILQYGMLEKEKNATMAHTTNTLQTIIHRTKISTSTIECLIQVRTRRHGALVGVTWSEEYMRFPPGFKFGAATASYQVEGAWNASDKGENIWDRFTHTRPDIITDGATGDVACDSYHLWRRDIEMATELGLHFYRLSLSWSRLLPSGFSNYVSEDGVRFYNDLIDGLLEKGIEPLVTIYHWDLPQPFQDLGGWTNPLIVDWFADYARVVFTLFGDRVKIWLTFNEPIIFCDMAYNSGLYAPGILDTELSPYLCNKNVMMAHAKAWRMYDEEFRWKYHGEVSLANHITWMSPWGEEDEELAELARENYGGRYSHPIFSKEGGWPPTIEKLMIENSRKRGYSRSVFPPFTQEEKEYVRGTFDFYGLNHYTSRLIRKARKDEPIGFWPVSGAPDLEAILERHPSWPVSPSFWFYINPEGIRRQLVWLKEKYGDIKFLITENGLATRSDLDDQNRVQFYKDYMREILLAINKDGINVTHYTAWTLMDNFEWADGYTVKFGLYEVDFSHPNRTRTPRASAAFYADVIRRHGLRISNDEH